jgi:hypothetical protein
MLSFFRTPVFSKAAAVFLLFLAAADALFANPDLKYELENRIVQYLNWPAQEDTLLYELVIEREDDGAIWTPVLRQTTEETTLKTALPAGKYRYRVDVWDLLGRRRPPASWANLIILKASQPALEKIQPDSINLEEDGPWRITVTGENMAENSEAVLSRPDGTQIEPDRWTVQSGGQSGALEFSARTLQEGVYSVTVRNPGGMEASMPNFHVRYGSQGGGGQGKWTDRNFMFSLGYNSLYTVSGELVRGYFGNYLHSEYYPIGVFARLSYLPVRGKFGVLGFELSPSWHWMESENHESMNGNYRVRMHLIAFGFAAAYRTPVFFRHLDFVVRAGGGIALGYQLEVNLEGRVSTQTFWGQVPFVEGGAAFQFLFNRVFFFEAGANYFMVFSESNAAFIRPVASIGWNF